MLKTKIKSIINDFIIRTKDKISEYNIGVVVLNKEQNVRKGWKIGGLIVLGMLVQAGISDAVPSNVYNEEVSQYEATIRDKDSEITELNSKLELKKSTYETLVEETEYYTSLSGDEKDVVDGKIAEIKQATADQLAAEEKAKADEERKAKETADKENANAIAKAKAYLDYSGFSRNGLIKQLEYEGYPTDSATYAADNCGADWNSECAEKAQSYLDYTSFSRDGLYNQLAYEEFTDEQIQFGLSAVGY